jgi:5-bromo-4-chloroindolyl phosphate hydrolysis protein
MKTLLLLFSILIHNPVSPKVKVYICNSAQSKRYHLKNTCHGLSNCTHRIVTMSLEEAKKRKFELCKYER